jgi:hypothetical protein
VNECQALYVARLSGNLRILDRLEFDLNLNLLALDGGVV